MAAAPDEGQFRVGQADDRDVGDGALLQIAGTAPPALAVRQDTGGLRGVRAESGDGGVTR
ncbi:hypothetical protein [Actinomadura formosensis]|uniref:hypothetical protein n=1 Tax=Actinomadura formosensis TaxID=60706 RepID=UPI000832577D|nr:hypothetical protein [Actinomadura formosensis]